MRDFVFETEWDNFFKTFDWYFANGNWGETKVEQKKNGTVESKDGKSTITLDVPGFKREEIKINIQDKKLVVAMNGKRGEKKYIYTLFETADLNSIAAKLEDGVLTIEVSTKPEPAPIEIKIQ